MSPSNLSLTESETAGPLHSHARPRCRANSRRGLTDPASRSYEPVEAVRRALQILNAVNCQRISTVTSLYDETGFPKSTIVRMLETLIAEGYVVRDNMCGGYRVTSKVSSLSAGYSGMPRVIEVARPMAIELTKRIKWPSGLGMMDGDRITIQFWTGAISPLAYTNTTLGRQADLMVTAMGRVYLAHCQPSERERHLERFRADPKRNFGPAQERRFLALLKRVREEGYAVRDSTTEPKRITTLGVPLLENGEVRAMMSASFFKSAVSPDQIGRQILQPLMESRVKIEQTLAFMARGATDHPEASVELSF